jgi:uncharacterized MAPEG superfamily protein
MSNLLTRVPAFTLAHGCILVAALLPLLCAWIAKWGTFRVPRSQGGYDNTDPRAWLARQEGWRARANAAQANSFEGLPFFIGAVLAAWQLGAPQGRLICWPCCTCCCAWATSSPTSVTWPPRAA